ncbi:MAG: carbohydrate binding domain-containing protein, partial [Calditrichaceae bacterium]
MVKKLQLIVVLVLCLSFGLFAQVVVVNEQFESGAGNWDGWIDTGSATVTASVDATGKLSGTNSYLLDITNGSADTYRIQRNTNCPLLAGQQYTVSFLAVADKPTASINVLFEIDADPWTKRLNETALVDTVAKLFTYVASISQNVANNELKLHFGGTGNNNTKIWVDSVVVTYIPDPTLVTKWGATSAGNHYPILNDSSTADGAAAMGSGAPPTAWSTISGQFNQLLEATTDEAVVVSGKFEYVGGGGGDTYTPLRYALTYVDSIELKYQYTDSAMWVATADSAKNKNKHSGYGFHPRTGSGVMSNGAGGSGTVWTINRGTWTSTWSNNGGPIAAVNQTPRNSKLVAGVYDWAISVKKISDTENEIRWYFVETTSKYSFAGSAIDTAANTKFNSVSFGVNTGDYTQVNLMQVKAELGDPITVPGPIWEAYFLDMWGLTGAGKAWPILNDTSTYVGDGYIGGENPIPGWATIRGGFGQDVSIPSDKAIVVTGEMEFVGGGCGDTYTPLRYALTYVDSMELKYQLTDSAAWVSTADSAKNSDRHYGWGYHPRTGAGTMSNGNGGSGTVWTINRGTWNSTWGNNGLPIAAVKQAPRNAEIIEGVYEWAISVQ